MDKLNVKLDNRYSPTDDEIRFICSCYDIGNLIEYNGDFNNFSGACIKLLTDEGRYVMRFSCAEPNRIEYINSMLALLKANSIPVPTPLVNRNGSCYMHTGTGRAVQITEFVESYKIDLAEKQFHCIGKMLRRFHDVLKDVREGPCPETSIYASTAKLLEGVERLHEIKGSIPEEQIGLVDMLYNQVGVKWEHMYRGLPGTIIHGDWSPKNLLFNRNGSISCILDFDFMQKAERIYDVAYLIWYAYNSGIRKNLIRAFIGGYGRITAEEKTVIPNIMARLSLFFISFASMNPSPEKEFRYQFEKQLPFINWLLSGEGMCEINSLL